MATVSEFMKNTYSGNNMGMASLVNTIDMGSYNSQLISFIGCLAYVKILKQWEKLRSGRTPVLPHTPGTANKKFQ